MPTSRGSTPRVRRVAPEGGGLRAPRLILAGSRARRHPRRLVVFLERVSDPPRPTPIIAPRAPSSRFPSAEFTNNERPKALKLLNKGVCRTHARRAFRLWDKNRAIAYENFDLDSVRDGDTIQVNFELYDKMLVKLEDRRIELRKEARAGAKFARKAQSSEADAGTPRMGARSLRGDDSENVAKAESPRKVMAAGANKPGGGSPGGSLLRSLSQTFGLSPSTRTVSGRSPGSSKSKLSMRSMVNSRGAHTLVNLKWEALTPRERAWVFLDVPSSSNAAAAFALFTLSLIVYSTVTFCAATLHGFYVSDLTKDSYWYVSESFCIAFFTVEICARIWATPDRGKFVRDPMNVVDIVAVLPYYVELILSLAVAGDAEVPGLAVIRVLRLVRVFRLLKMSRGSVTMFAETMVGSIRPLSMLLILVSISMVVCASFVYFIERGRWNDQFGYWERATSYRCAVVVPKDAAPGVTASTLALGATTAPYYSAGYDNPCDLAAVADDRASATFECEYPYERDSSCDATRSQSPYDSIVASFWWSWVTMTTVGYGDHAPVSVLGKVFAMLVMFYGVLVIALPVTVIGSNFSGVYHRMNAEAEAEARKLATAERKREAESRAVSRQQSGVEGGSVRGGGERDPEPGDFQARVVQARGRVTEATRAFFE